jgi:superfamily II DNA or RNA helicase
MTTSSATMTTWATSTNDAEWMTVSPNLRNYQVKIRARCSDGAQDLYQAPTGFGNTVLFNFVVQNAVARGNRVAIVMSNTMVVGSAVVALTMAFFVRGGGTP